VNLLGLAPAHSWAVTVGFSLLWLALMIAYTPVADRLASVTIEEPPKLGAFRAVQRSRTGLVAGIVIAWVVGGFLEEFLLRGIVLRFTASFLEEWLSAPLAATIAILAAATLATFAHLYQGRRGALIVGQLSVLFGILYVISGYDLWAVVLCHGTYDTIAFVRFARGTSRYSRLDVSDGSGDTPEMGSGNGGAP
jgi:membrane protease YdiL (CAAX protease family)